VELTPREFAYLRDAKDKQALFDLEDLVAGQLDRLDQTELFLAYKQSQATVSYLKNRYGARHLAQLLASLAHGEDADTAMRRTFRVNYDTLQLAVAEFIQNG
jgi:hypothetical protein